MMRDDTFHHCAIHGFRSLLADPVDNSRKPGIMTRSGPLLASVFPRRSLWQPSHGYIARLHGILAHWLQPYVPDPNGFGARA
jgi:hypothetical protein